MYVPVNVRGLGPGYLNVMDWAQDMYETRICMGQ